MLRATVLLIILEYSRLFICRPISYALKNINVQFFRFPGFYLKILENFFFNLSHKSRWGPALLILCPIGSAELRSSFLDKKVIFFYLAVLARYKGL